MTSTRLTAVTLGLAAMCVAGVSAQQPGVHKTAKAKTEAKNEKAITVIGCVEKQSNGDYVLTPVRDAGHGRLQDSWYTLVTKQDLSAHVGERVTITGTAVMPDAGGAGSMDSRNTTDVATAAGPDTNSTMVPGTAGTGGTHAATGKVVLPSLGVRSIKTLSSCN
jgi:hypothetical protein